MSESWMLFFHYCRQGYPTDVTHFLNGRVSPLVVNKKGETALIALCLGAAPEMCAARPYNSADVLTTAKILLDMAPELLWTPDSRGRLPLHWAVACGRVELVQALVRAARALEEREGATEEDLAHADRALSGVDDYGYSPLRAAEAFHLIVTTAHDRAMMTAEKEGPINSAGEDGVPASGATRTGGSGGSNAHQQPQLVRPANTGGGGRRRRRLARPSESGPAAPLPKYDRAALTYTQGYGLPGWGGKMSVWGEKGRVAEPAAGGGHWEARKTWSTACIVQVAFGTGLYAALSGAGALRDGHARMPLLASVGIDYALRDARRLVLGEAAAAEADNAQPAQLLQPPPPRGGLTPAGRRAAMGAAEHAANVCHEIVGMRKAAASPQGGGGRQQGGGADRRPAEVWRFAFGAGQAWGKGAGVGGRGLSDAALAFVVQHHLLHPATPPHTVATWASILAESLGMALQAHDGDAAALLAHAYPSLRPGSSVWSALLGALGKLGRCLCFGLIGQQEGADGEILTQREEVLFENLLDVALRLLVPLSEGMAADGEDADGVAALRRLTEPYLGPVWRLMEDALASVDGMVEEPMRFAVLVRAYLAWTMATCSDDGASFYQKRVQALAASCAPRTVEAAEGREVRLINGSPLLKTLVAAASTSAPQASGRAPHRARPHQRRRGGPAGTQQQGSNALHFPRAFEAFVGRARGGLNRVLRGLPDALNGHLSMLLRMPDAVETAQKLEHMVVQLERQAHDSLLLTWNRFLEDEGERLELLVSQIAACDRQTLQRASLSVQLTDEPGIGDGPVRELMDALQPLFAPEVPSFLANKPRTAGDGLLLGAGQLPLFRRLEYQGDADAVGPRPPSRPVTTAASSLPTAGGPTLRQEEKGGEAALAAAAAAGDGVVEVLLAAGSPIQTSEGGVLSRAICSWKFLFRRSEEESRRERLFQVAGRVLGLALRNGMPLGVVIPPAVWRALLDLDDPSLPKERVVLPPPSSSVGGGKELAQEQQARPPLAPVAPPQEEQQQQLEGEGARAGGGGGNQGRSRRRRGKKGKGSTSPPQQSQEQHQKQSASSSTAISVPVGRWREYVGDDAALARSLEAVLAHDFDAPDASSSPLADTCFVLTEQGEEGKGKMEEAELVPQGAQVKVTNANKRAFVELVARRRLLRGADGEGGGLRALKQGLLDVLPVRFLVLFNPTELSAILSGPRTIDFPALRALVQYEHGLTAHSPVVQALWEVVTHELTPEEQRRFLLFWSGSSTPPALGFAQRADDEFAWTISRLTGPGVSPNSLPEASTCDRRLSLPDYPSAAHLRKKLRAAITHGCVGYDRV